jgi:hypothetical protein
MPLSVGGLFELIDERDGAVVNGRHDAAPGVATTV